MGRVRGLTAGLFVTLGVLTALLAPGRPSASVEGLVRDEHGPVAGALVRVPGTAGRARTDAAGRFSLPAPAAGRITAAKPGYFIAEQALDASPLRLALRRLPAEDHEAYAWLDPAPDPRQPQNCGNCHTAIYREWDASGHARSATSRHFRNLYDGTDWHGRPDRGWNLLAEHPDGAGVCAACHAPTLPALADPRQPAGVAGRGVHCDYCHKVAEVENEPLGLVHGRFALKLLRPAEGQLFFGPLDDAVRGNDAFSPLYRDSRYCAACHEGTVFGIPVYSTYSEWLDSPARAEGKQCQTCHMAPTGTLTNLAPGHGGVARDPATLASHGLFAGSREEMLRRCVSVQVDVAHEDGETAVGVVLVADGAGHRVPTGFVDRNLVLVVQAFDAGRQRVPARSGPVLSVRAGAELAGLAGRLYAKQLADFDGQGPVPFWRADPAVVDTRLLPGRADRVRFVFGGRAETVRVRVLHRRFWPEVARQKGWPDNEVTVFDRLAKPQAVEGPANR
jgi:hypothetical protein